MAAQGYIAEDQINLMVGGAMVIAAGLFSWIQKRMNNASVSKSSSGRKGRPRV